MRDMSNDCKPECGDYERKAEPETCHEAQMEALLGALPSKLPRRADRVLAQIFMEA